MGIWFCYLCNQGGKSITEEPPIHVCVPIKLSRTKKLINWLLSIHIDYLTCFMAGAIMNSIFISHPYLSNVEMIVESLCCGVVMMGIFKK